MKVCGDCGTENDDTRVFCLNCAKRLPASIPGSKPRPATESVGISAPKPITPQAPKTLLKLPQTRARFSTVLFRLFVLLLLGAAGFVAYLILQPPTEVPRPVPSASAEEVSQFASFLRDASRTSGGTWQGDESAINRFLTANVRPQPMGNSFGIKVAFERCYVELHEGRIDLTMQVTVFDHPLFLRVCLAPVAKGSGLGVRVVNAGLGHLLVPGPVAQFLLPLWNPCFAPIENTLATLKGGDSAKISPQRLVVRWPVSSSR